MASFVDAAVVGQHFNRKRETILAWAKRGLIPSYRLSKRIVLFDLAQVAAALRQQGQQGQGTEASHAS
jgi:hypothetical protein